MKLRGEVKIGGDKSISHRALFFSAFARGRSKVRRLSTAEDVRSTAQCLSNLGVKIYTDGDTAFVEGKGLFLDEPSSLLWAGNSGTTARILCTPLSAQKFPSALDGDSSLRKRPFKRIVEPLRRMGARIWGKEGGDKLPLVFDGVGKLKGGKFSAGTSAQVKTALLIANWWSDDRVLVKEEEKSRDHTERMLPVFGVRVGVEGEYLFCEGEPKSADIFVPADTSSASFFVLAGVLCENSRVVVRDVCLNPTRTGFFRALQKMGAKVWFENEREDYEPYGDVVAETSHTLRGISLPSDDISIPSAIDEIPCLAVAGAFAEGDTVVRGAQELRVKESDRIHAICYNLRQVVEVEEFDDGFVIRGMGRHKLVSNAREKGRLKFKSFGDHRIAMAFYIMGIALGVDFEVDDLSVVRISFPDFFVKLREIAL